MRSHTRATAGRPWTPGAALGSLKVVCTPAPRPGAFASAEPTLTNPVTQRGCSLNTQTRVLIADRKVLKPCTSDGLQTDRLPGVLPTEHVWWRKTGLEVGHLRTSPSVVRVGGAPQHKGLLLLWKPEDLRGRCTVSSGAFSLASESQPVEAAAGWRVFMERPPSGRTGGPATCPREPWTCLLRPVRKRGWERGGPGSDGMAVGTPEAHRLERSFQQPDRALVELHSCSE